MVAGPALEWKKASISPNAPPQANGAYTVYRTRVKVCVVLKFARVLLLKREMAYVVHGPLHVGRTERIYCVLGNCNAPL